MIETTLYLLLIIISMLVLFSMGYILIRLIAQFTIITLTKSIQMTLHEMKRKDMHNGETKED